MTSVNPSIGPQQQSRPPQAQSDQTSDGAGEEAKRIRQEMSDRMLSIDSRLSGAQNNAESTQKELDNTGFWAWTSGHTSTLKEQLEKETKYRDEVAQRKSEFEQTQRKIDQLLKQGKVEEARAILDGKETEYKQKMQATSSKMMQGYQDANKKLQDTDKFLANTETGLRIARDTCVIAAATVATGGVAAPLMAGAGIVAGGAAAVAVGTAAGTTIGALSNLTEATGHVAYGNKDASKAFSDAAMQTLTDARSSAVTSLSTVAGVGVAGKMMGTLGTAGQATAQAVSLTTKIGVGMAAGGTGSVVSTTINTSEQYVRARVEFNQTYGNSGLSGERLDQVYTEFMKQRGLTGEQIAKNAAINIGIGLISGGQGAGAQAARDATSSVAKKILITSAEATGSSLIGISGAYARDGEITLQDAMQETISSGAMSYVGGVSTSAHQGGTVKEVFAREFGSMPTFAEAPAAIGGLFSKQAPPPPKTSAPDSNGSTQKPQNDGQTDTHQNTNTTEGTQTQQNTNETVIDPKRLAELSVNNKPGPHNGRRADAECEIKLTDKFKANGFTEEEASNHAQNITRLLLEATSSSDVKVANDSLTGKEVGEFLSGTKAKPLTKAEALERIQFLEELVQENKGLEFKTAKDLRLNELYTAHKTLQSSDISHDQQQIIDNLFAGKDNYDTPILKARAIAFLKKRASITDAKDYNGQSIDALANASNALKQLAALKNVPGYDAYVENLLSKSAGHEHRLIGDYKEIQAAYNLQQKAGYTIESLGKKVNGAYGEGEVDIVAIDPSGKRHYIEVKASIEAFLEGTILPDSTLKPYPTQREPGQLARLSEYSTLDSANPTVTIVGIKERNLSPTSPEVVHIKDKLAKEAAIWRSSHGGEEPPVITIVDENQNPIFTYKLNTGELTFVNKLGK